MLALASTACVMILSESSAFAAEILHFCYEMADVRPWRTAAGTGLNFDLINSAAGRVGTVVEYHALPWKRCLAELKLNRMDGALAASFKKDRMDIGAFPGGSKPEVGKRLHVDRYVVLRRKGSSVDWDGRAFRGLEGPVGIQLGYSVGEQLKSMNVAVDDGSLTLRELLLKLAAGRLGAAAVLGSEMRYFSQQDAALAASIDTFPRPLIEKPYYLMLSHKLVASNPMLAGGLWKAIEAARNSAEYRKAEQDAVERSAP